MNADNYGKGTRAEIDCAKEYGANLTKSEQAIIRFLDSPVFIEEFRVQYKETLKKLLQGVINERAQLDTQSDYNTPDHYRLWSLENFLRDRQTQTHFPNNNKKWCLLQESLDQVVLEKDGIKNSGGCYQ